jgi:hypothetical protein
MGQTPLPSYDQLVAMAGGDKELAHKFIEGMILNPPRQSWWANWRTRKLRARIEARECDGSAACRASTHIEGCFAEKVRR